MMSQEVVMPALSTSMTEGKLLRWLKREGDPVRKGEVIAEIETDKAVLELEAVDAGRLLRILVAEGTEGVPVNQPIALLETAGNNPQSADSATPAAVSEPENLVIGAVSGAHGTGTPQAQTGSRVLASPLARRMAHEKCVDLRGLAGSGPRGRVIAADVRAAYAAGSTSIPHSAARKIAAKRLVEAKATIPHFYLATDCEIDALLGVRAKLNAGQSAELRISINDCIVRACALALRKTPRVNAIWGEEAIQLNRDVDVSVAVATPDGLITPILRHADTKPIALLSAELRDLARRARERKLRPEEYQGGGFTVSNLGMYGIRQFTAIINPPQAAILAVGAAEQRPIVRDGSLGIATVITLTLSCDHRVIDGADGAQFLRTLQILIQDADLLLA